MVLHVHLVPHSHTDPGWLNTYAGYSGSTRGILDRVLEGLEAVSYTHLTLPTKRIV